MEKFTKGSEWRRWDLHVHTKDTFKNDLFNSGDFDQFCIVFFRKAIENNIKVIGVTDYFSLLNYKKVLNYIENIDDNENFTPSEIKSIKDIFILPNIELRLLPVTDRGRMVNLHIIINPDYVSDFEQDFLGSIDMTIGDIPYKMNENGLIQLGKSKGASNDLDALKLGVESFVVSHEKINKVLKNRPNLKDNLITIVSNSNHDGVSAFQKHFDFFEEVDKNSLEEVRKAIYFLSDFIFSGNPKDKSYFLGQKKNSQGIIIDDEYAIVEKCGSLKPVIHGSDAHSEDELFKPDQERNCWIKADPTFKGLKQLLNEPEHRIYIGDKPDVLKNISLNRTKKINKLIITANTDYDNSHGIWFDEVEIPLNMELVAIIGNKGNGKSAIADIIALCSNYKGSVDDYSFLNPKKFNIGNGKIAKNFTAKLIWESGMESGKILSDLKTENDVELVKYLPQGYFEKLTNEIESIEEFRTEIENVVFTHISDENKIGYHNFKDLLNYKTEIIESEIRIEKDKIERINREIVLKESKLNPEYISKIEARRKLKQAEIDALIKPEPVLNPNDDPNILKFNEEVNEKINIIKDQMIVLSDDYNAIILEHKTLIQTNEKINNLKQRIVSRISEFENFKEEIGLELENYDIKVNEIIKSEYYLTPLNTLLDTVSLKVVELAKKIDDKAEGSLQFLILQKENELQIAKSGLGEDEKKYQKYLEEKNQWDEMRKTLIGNATITDTLIFFESEILYINEQLNIDLQILKDRRLTFVKKIYEKKLSILEIYKGVKTSIDEIIDINSTLLSDYKISVEASFNLTQNLQRDFLRFISSNKIGTYYGKDNAEIQFKKIISNAEIIDFNDISDLITILNQSLFKDLRDSNFNETHIENQIVDVDSFYDYLYSLDYLEINYQLKQDDKDLQQLSPGEKGALLLIFYLLLDKNDIPLLIDQPEDNLDNQSVANILVPFIKTAKKFRQVIIVTHNPNLAVVADADQVIYVELNKKDDNRFAFKSGSIENPEINKCIVKVLEGAMPAFNKRKDKYYN